MPRAFGSPAMRSGVSAWCRPSDTDLRTSNVHSRRQQPCRFRDSFCTSSICSLRLNDPRLPVLSRRPAGPSAHVVHECDEIMALPDLHRSSQPYFGHFQATSRLVRGHSGPLAARLMECSQMLARRMKGSVGRAGGHVLHPHPCPARPCPCRGDARGPWRDLAGRSGRTARGLLGPAATVAGPHGRHRARLGAGLTRSEGTGPPPKGLGLRREKE